MIKKILYKQGAGLCLLSLSLSWVSTGLADTSNTPPPESDPALETALLYDGNGEGVEIKRRITHDLVSGSPGTEQVVLWTMLGPTYWSTFISVASKQSGQWKSLARVNLNGAEAELDSVGADGVINLSAKVPGPNDPICCPSQPKKLKYRYVQGKLVEATLGGRP
ncbi:MAG: hypothetical protein ABL903_18115 [Methylococcales bacterium]